MLIPEGGQAHRVAVWQLLEVRLKYEVVISDPNLQI